MFEYSQKWNRVQAHIKIKWYTIYTDSHRDMHTHRKFRTDIFVGNQHEYTRTRHTYNYMQKELWYTCPVLNSWRIYTLVSITRRLAHKHIHLYIYTSTHIHKHRPYNRPHEESDGEITKMNKQ